MAGKKKLLEERVPALVLYLLEAKQNLMNQQNGSLSSVRDMPMNQRYLALKDGIHADSPAVTALSLPLLRLHVYQFVARLFGNCLDVSFPSIDPDFVIKGELQWPFEQAVLANMKGIWRLLIDFPTRKILLQAQEDEPVVCRLLGLFASLKRLRIFKAKWESTGKSFPRALFPAALSSRMPPKLSNNPKVVAARERCQALAAGAAELDYYLAVSFSRPYNVSRIIPEGRKTYEIFVQRRQQGDTDVFLGADVELELSKNELFLQAAENLPRSTGRSTDDKNVRETLEKATKLVDQN
ncbi:hypothetical protein M432DRAFT_668614 [Thermoascus aurantiacus ATCC 26904]